MTPSRFLTHTHTHPPAHLPAQPPASTHARAHALTHARTHAPHGGQGCTPKIQSPGFHIFPIFCMGHKTPKTCRAMQRRGLRRTRSKPEVLVIAFLRMFLSQSSCILGHSRLSRLLREAHRMTKSCTSFCICLHLSTPSKGKHQFCKSMQAFQAGKALKQIASQVQHTSGAKLCCNACYLTLSCCASHGTTTTS